MCLAIVSWSVNHILFLSWVAVELEAVVMTCNIWTSDSRGYGQLMHKYEHFPVVTSQVSYHIKDKNLHVFSCLYLCFSYFIQPVHPLVMLKRSCMHLLYMVCWFVFFFNVDLQSWSVWQKVINIYPKNLLPETNLQMPFSTRVRCTDSISSGILTVYINSYS